MRKSSAAIWVTSMLALQLLAPIFAQVTLNYAYDANGNLVSGDGKFYEYNDANQLIRVRHKDGNGPVIAEFFYDHTGQRIKKSEDGITTYYVGKHFEAQLQETGLANTSYYFANSERVAKKDPEGQLSSFHTDHLGSTNAVTDATGNVVERTNYFPFGEIRTGGSEKYTYTGKEKDMATEQYYYEARFYNPQFAHFTQPDSVVPGTYNPQNLNRYVYVVNNPLKYGDPTGHSPLSTSIKQRVNSAYEYVNTEAEQAYKYARENTVDAAKEIGNAVSDPHIRSFMLSDLIKGKVGLSNKAAFHGVGDYDVAGSMKSDAIWSVAIPEKIGSVDVTRAASIHDTEYENRVSGNFFAKAWAKSSADFRLSRNIILDNWGEDGAVRIGITYGTLTFIGGWGAYFEP